MQHEVSQHDLESGARLLLINIPNSVSCYLASYVRSGFRFAQPAQFELPHLLEHLAFEGNTSYPDPLAFKSAVEKNGAYFNAYTSTDLNAYEYVGNSAELDELLPLAVSQIYEPLFEPLRIKQQQETIVNEWSRNLDDDGHRLAYAASANFFPQFAPDIKERIRIVQSLSRSDIVDFHESHYVTQNTFFVVSGPYANTSHIVDTLNKLLQNRPSGKAAVYKKAQINQAYKAVVTLEAQQNQQSRFNLRFGFPGRDEKNFAALRVISAMLTSGLSSRLKTKAREAGLTYSIGSGAGLSDEYTSLTLVSQTGSDKLKALVELTMAEVAAIASDNYDDTELARAIGYESGILRRTKQTPSNYGDWYGDDFAMGQQLISPEERIHQIRAVDRSAVTRAAKRYLTTDYCALVLMGRSLEEQTQKYGDMMNHYFSRQQKRRYTRGDAS